MRLRAVFLRENQHFPFKNTTIKNTTNIVTVRTNNPEINLQLKIKKTYKEHIYSSQR